MFKLGLKNNDIYEQHHYCSLMESWSVLRTLYPQEKWYQLLGRWYQFKTGHVQSPNYPKELDVEVLHELIVRGDFGGPEVAVARKFDNKGKIVDS